MVPVIRRTKKSDKKDSTTELPPPPDLSSESSVSPPPLIFSEDILSRPPITERSEPPKLYSDDPNFSKGEYSPDILSELEESGFGSLLKAIPPKESSVYQIKDHINKQFRTASDAYLKAADKHLELGFIENASVNYSCAVLCILISEDVYQAVHLMKKLGEKIPPSVIRSQIFQGVRMVLKANLLKNPEFLVKAKDWLISDYEHLYKEDKLLIQRAITLTENKIEEE